MSFFKYLLPKVKCGTNNDDINSMLNNPYASEEEKNQIRNELNKQEHQPGINFSRLSMIYKNQIANNWNGLKFSFLFNPNQLFNIDYSLFLQRSKKKFQHLMEIAATCFIPTHITPSSGVMLVGRRDNPEALSLQSHINLSDKDKIALLMQYPNNQIENAMHIIEISHDFKRMNVAAKISNSEPFSLSSIACLYRNLFVGIEAYKYPNEYSLGYNYSLFYKQGIRNRLGFVLSYLSNVPGTFCDICFRVNEKFNISCNFLRAFNPMVGQINNGAIVNIFLFYYIVWYL